MPKKPTRKPTKKATAKSFANESIWTPTSNRPYGYGYGRDSREEPSAWALLGAFSDVVYSAIGLIAPNVGREADKYKLIVRTGPRDEQPKSVTKSIPFLTKQRIEEQYPQYMRRAVQIDEVTDHGLLDLLDNPNPHQSFRSLVELIDTYLELVGSAFVYIQRIKVGGKGIPTALWVLPSQYITIETDEQGRLTGYKYKAGRNERDYLPQDIIHFKFNNPSDPYTSLGISPTKAVWERVCLLESEQHSWQSVLNNMAFPSMLIYPPDGEVYSPNQAQRIEKQLSEKGRLYNNGGMWVVTEPMKMNPFSTPPKDLSALQLYQALRSSVSSAFNVPISMLDLSASTGGDGNPTSEGSDTVRRNFQRYCLLPRIEMILETFSHHLCPPRMWLVADTTVSPDKIFELQRTTALVSGNIIRINEGRVAQGYEPLPGLDKLQCEIAPGVGTPSAQTFQTSFTPPVTKGQSVRYRSTVPNPEALLKALQPVFEKLAKSVMGSIGKGFGGWQTKAFFPLDEWTDEMKRDLIPVVRVYMQEGAEGVLGAVGGSPEIKLHAVQELDKAVNRLVLALAQSTLSTTELGVSEAVDATREAIRAGLSEGEANDQLAKRIGDVFKDLSERRALLIAETESSRAKHAGELIAIDAAGVVAKKVWLPDSMACPECRAVAAKGAIPLNQPFAKNGNGPYSVVDHPPYHPQCRCTMQYQFEEK